MHALHAEEATGGFIAYSRHLKGWNGAPDEKGRREIRIVYVEELAGTAATRGHKLSAGTRLIQQMVQADRDWADEYHLMVRTTAHQQAHARALTTMRILASERTATERHAYSSLERANDI